MKSLILFFAGLLLVNSAVGALEGLESYNVDKSTITVSGASSGAAMAMQYHVAYSGEVYGAAIFAGPPYACATGVAALAECMANITSLPGRRRAPGSTLIFEDLAEEMLRQQTLGRIDHTDNLKDSKVFVIRGTFDPVVSLVMVKVVAQLYEEFGAVVETEFSVPAGHGFPTDFAGGPCGLTNPLSDFINNCSYNGAFISLNSLFGGSLTAPPTGGPVDMQGKLVEFDQRQHGNVWNAGMGRAGYMYVPPGCQDRTTQCKLHVAFHGCLQSRENIGNVYATKTGYIQVADANNIIVLFPQTAPSIINPVINPMACWDWWGYSGLNFLNRNGKQMQIIRNMIERVSTCKPETGCDPTV